MDAIDGLARLIEEHAGDLPSRELARRSGDSISYETINKIRKRTAGTPARRTLEGLHRALRVPLSDVYAAAGMSMDALRLPAGTEDLDDARRAALFAMALDLVEQQRRETGN